MINTVPLIVRYIDSYVEECLDDMKMNESDYRKPSAFNAWIVTFVVNILFILMHLSNYPKEDARLLYYFLVFGINLPWTLSCVRNYSK